MKTQTRFFILLALLLVFASALCPSTPSKAADSSSIYYDAILDPTRGRIFATNITTGRLDVISMETLDIITSIEVGRNPFGLDLRPDGNELAVASIGELIFIDPESLSITWRIIPNTNGHQSRPFDVLYGPGGRVYSTGGGLSYGLDYLHIFDTATKTEVGRSEEIINDSPQIALKEDGQTIYVFENSYFSSFYRFDVSTTHPILKASNLSLREYYGEFCVTSDGRIITSRGDVWSSDLNTKLATLRVNGDQINSNKLICDLAHNKAYIPQMGGGFIQVFDLQTYDLVERIALPWESYLIRLTPDASRLYVATASGFKMIRLNDQRTFIPVISSRFCHRFSDDFNDPNSGWPVITGDTVSTYYFEGDYRIQTASDEYYYTFAAPGCLIGDYDINARLRWGDSIGDSYGMIFEVSGDFESFYLFDVNPLTGLARLLRVQGDNVELMHWRTGIKAHDGQEYNDFYVRRQGNQITLFLNGETLMGAVQQPLSKTTRAGVVVFPITDRPNVDARVDSFSFSSSRFDIETFPRLITNLLQESGQRIRLPDFKGW